MPDMNPFDLATNLPILAALAVVVLTVFQLFLIGAMLVVLRIASKERAQSNREIFGLVKKIEGLTAERREQMLQHYDRMLEALSNKIPVMVASHAGEKIFETESRILARLAELEPNIKGSELGRRKVDELIKSMEGLEDTLINLTSDAVKQVLTESRKELLQDDHFFGIAKRAA
jgi:hypothetical protein